LLEKPPIVVRRYGVAAQCRSKAHCQTRSGG
jgi:hypothetical protein